MLLVTCQKGIIVLLLVTVHDIGNFQNSLLDSAVNFAVER